MAIVTKLGLGDRRQRTGPNDKVNIVLLLVQKGLLGPNDKEVKIGNQVVNTGLIYVSKQ